MHETRELSLDSIQTRYVASVQTDPGCVRESNEDSGRFLSPTDPQSKLKKGTLMIVADGMGGHASGEIASKMAVDIITREYYADDGDLRPESLRCAVEAANEAIYQASTSDQELLGMGTTLVALVLLDDVGFSAHVGDSRLYRFRGRKLQMLTMDHSEVMEMVQQGVLTMEQARNHEDKNVILRAVGTQPTVQVEISDALDVKFGDVFLLCSDGLTDMLEDREIEAILDQQTDAHLACERLIAEAKRLGGHDNITTGIIRVTAEEGAAANLPARITRELEAAA